VLGRHPIGSGPIFRNTCDQRLLGYMPHYIFDISNGHPFQDEHGEELFDDDAAWRNALHTVRDIEDVLRPGDSWRLDVSRELKPLFRIELSSRKL
jgi:hypothetical protein